MNTIQKLLDLRRPPAAWSFRDATLPGVSCHGCVLGSHTASMAGMIVQLQYIHVQEIPALVDNPEFHQGRLSS